AEGFDGVQRMVIKCFTYDWFAGMLIAFAVFIPFFAIKELSRVLGEGKISALFFHKGAETKINVP
ncbi:MAG: hypothetical protein WC412_09120, partial [Candidatus Omnitrophota bacterium]